MAITKEVNIVVKETGLDEVNKKVNKLETSVSSLEDQQRSLANSMADSSQSVLDNGGAMGLLNDATGGLAMTVKDAVEASVLFTKSQKAAAIVTAIQTTVIGTSTGAMKAFRIALAATGIGLIVIGLGLLIANFDKVKKVVMNLIPGLALVGDFVMGIVESITDFIGVTSEAERALAELTEQAKKSNAMNEKFLAEEGDRVNEYTRQKIEAKKRYNDAVQEEGANEKALAARLNRELLAIDKKHNDDLGKVRKDKQDKIDAANKEATDKRKEATLKEQEEEKQRLADEAKAKLDIEMQSAKDAISILDELKKNVETPAQKEQREFEEKKAILEANNLSTEELEVQHIDAMFAISEEDRKKKEEQQKDKEAKDKEAADKEIAQAQAVADAKTEINARTVDNISSTIGLIASLAGKNKAIQAATVIADAGIGIFRIITNTNAANAAASLKYALLPGGQALAAAEIIQNKISAGIGIAGTTIAAGKALASLGKGGGVQGGSASGGGSAPQAPSFNLVQGTGRNQIAEGLNRQTVVKAYVVPTDVSTGQSMDRNIVKSASL